MGPEANITLTDAYRVCGVTRRTWYNWLEDYPATDDPDDREPHHLPGLRESWKAPGVNGMRMYTRGRVEEIAADHQRTPDWSLLKKKEATS